MKTSNDNIIAKIWEATAGRTLRIRDSFMNTAFEFTVDLVTEEYGVVNFSGLNAQGKTSEVWINFYNTGILIEDGEVKVPNYDKGYQLFTLN